ncbi:flavin monoamine oxidase family protein [Roseivirga sp. BDSF3-8]|uniref:flavin monoamine oxidase family protein n=1 Tax=Roseivirga sp. BDSF3-8 TaxID=3241598 RepID=UPI00353268E5
MINNNKIFHAVPSGKPSLRAAYELWLKSQTDVGKTAPESFNGIPQGATVGIIGGGMAGLYSALILKSRGVNFHVLEASSRLGGRVYTYRFNEKPNQYFEAGAMRLPDIPEQEPVFNLIDYLNERVSPDMKIDRIRYVLYDDDGNRVNVNSTRNSDGGIMSVKYANTNPAELGFILKPEDQGKTATELLNEVIQPFVDMLEKDFEKGFQAIIQYDDYSFYSYLQMEAGWYNDKINYVETMTSQTNQFQNSFTELIIENIDFSQANWYSIANGMDRLPNACAEVVGYDNITLDAPVNTIQYTDDGRVRVFYGSDYKYKTFDYVIAAVPPAVLKMLVVPQWSSSKTQAIRSLHFEPLYKIGMRFKTRFWEKVKNPSFGGQSISDLPSRWFVYPSYGFGDDDEGVLLLYSWMTDAYVWLAYSEEERQRIALRDLQAMYPEVKLFDQFIESFDVSWSQKWATGDAMFYPGQFRNLFNIARQPEGRVFFAGEHLSVHHTWIVGALDSALLACGQLLGQPLSPIVPEGKDATTHTYDYSGIHPCQPKIQRPERVAAE